MTTDKEAARALVLNKFGLCVNLEVCSYGRLGDVLEKMALAAIEQERKRVSDLFFSNGCCGPLNGCDVENKICHQPKEQDETTD